MKLTIHPEKFLEIIKKSYSLDIIYLLKLIEQNYDVSELCKENVKINVLYNTLIRKGLITETEDKLTILGTELLEFIESKSSTKFKKKKFGNDGFDSWWENYPGTDKFEYKGKSFPATRALRANKDECRAKFNKILLEGDYTSEQLIEALKYDVKSKKDNSVSTGTKKLSFMQNSLTYLNQRTFEPFIEIIKEGKVIENNDYYAGSTDI